MELSLSTHTGNVLNGTEAIIERYTNALICENYEMSFDFGCSLHAFVGEPASPRVTKAIAQLIKAMTEKHFPEIVIRQISITIGDGTVTINMNVLVVPTGDTVEMEIGV